MTRNFLQKWNGKFFERVTLKQLGLVVQVGHGDMLCYCPERGHTNFLVIDINGIHPVSVNFCGCEQRTSHRQQLLRCAWYPSTVHNPRTACTRRVLDHFLRLTWSSKVSAYEYYHTLERLTDNTGINVPTVRVIVHQFVRHSHFSESVFDLSTHGSSVSPYQTTQKGGKSE